MLEGLVGVGIGGIYWLYLLYYMTCIIYYIEGGRVSKELCTIHAYNYCMH